VFAAKDCAWEGKLGVIMEGGGYGLCGQGLCVGGKIRSNNGRGWIRSLRSGTVCRGGRTCNKKWKRVVTVIAVRDCVGGKIRSKNGRGWIRSLRSGTVCGREKV